MTEEMNRGRRMRLLAVLCLVAAFVAGGLAGAAAEHARGRMDRDRGHRERGSFLAPGGELDQRLHLTAAQRDSIQKIVRRDQAKADEVFRQMHPLLRARFDSTMTAIEGVLTPEQRGEFRRFREEHRERRRDRDDRGGRPPRLAPPPPPQ